MNPSRELQKVVHDLLLRSGAVNALIGDRVYDGVPQDPTFPYVSFGPSDFVPLDLECIDSREHSLQLDVWSRDQGRKWKCKDIVDAVHAALHLAEAQMNGAHLVQLRVTLARVFDDPDGITAHGVVSVEADINVE